MAALLATPVLFGCGSSPKSAFYTLSAGTAPMQASATPPLSVAIGPVTVPHMVDRPQIVLRASMNQITISEFARWSAPLKDEIPRVIADNLTERLRGAYVSTYPQAGSADADYLVTIDVRRFDSALGDAATVEVLWTVRPPKGEVKAGRSVAREPTRGTDYDALVSAHGRALAAVSNDIADAILASAGKGR
jgi:uncharacterized lipoprotein YmbA